MIEQIIISAFFILGLHSVADFLLGNWFDKDLNYIQQSIDSKILAKILKPVIFCIVCMSSFWGSVCYLYFAESPSILGWLFFIFPLAGINYIFFVIKNFDRKNF